MNNKKKKIILIIGILILITLIIILLINNSNNDGMENNGIVNVYYRTYTKEKGWSNWTKNGMTSGNKKYDILNIEIKSKTEKYGFIMYRIATLDNEWSEKEYNIDNKFKNTNMSGIEIGLTDELNKKYVICYRTYNEKNKWFNWSCAGEANGNKNKNIKAIEVKIIPKNVVYSDYLKKYKNSEVKSEGF